MALDYVKEGFMIGIGGVITFKNGKKLREVVEAIPLESIVVETDAPYLAPEPYRGKRNDSRYLKYIIEEIGKIKGRSPEDVEDITYQNGKRLFFD
jgi:TatD DNase family protein